MSEQKVWGIAPDNDEFARLAQAALDQLDEPFRSEARNVSIRIEDVADPETLEALHIEDPLELTGLYSGGALTLESITSPSTIPPVVWLYRLPILDEWLATGDVGLEELVAHVLIHELGHHFGWSDEEMDAIQAADD